MYVSCIVSSVSSFARDIIKTFLIFLLAILITYKDYNTTSMQTVIRYLQE